MSIVSDISSEAELEEKINSVVGPLIPTLITELGTLVVEYKQAKRDLVIGVATSIFAFTLVQISVTIFGGWSAIIALPVTVVLFFYGCEKAFRNYSAVKRYHDRVDQVIIPKVLAILGLEGQVLNQPEKIIPRVTFNFNLKRLSDFLQSLHSLKNEQSPAVLANLDTSLLITELHNTNRIDTVLEINQAGAVLSVAELDVKHVTGSGKNSNTKHIFKGYFVTMPLRKVLRGKTFVTTEKDTAGFGNIHFWTKGKVGIPMETILEWNEFENMLHVTTTDETEARYILTPNFMHDVFDWWKEHKTNIRISFIDNRLYILFPDERIRLGQTVSNLTEKEIADYLYTIARPLWHVVRLVEKVRV